jgi:lipoprotein-anchoring transpeptidase ErfK/SrfK
MQAGVIGNCDAEVGDRMRKAIIPVAALCLGIAASGAPAGQIKFSPDAFEIYGGLGNSPVKQKKRRYAGKQTVDFQTDLKPGSILVRTGERRLYYILPDGRAIRYAVGVGREGFTWSGTNRVTRKAMWPEWRPPQVMIERERLKGRTIPVLMEGGVENPLGARALYIGDTEYRIHGTSQPWSIGMAVSSGCIRMLNEEVIDLYNRAEVGATVMVE